MGCAPSAANHLVAKEAGEATVGAASPQNAAFDGSSPPQDANHGKQLRASTSLQDDDVLMLQSTEGDDAVLRLDEPRESTRAEPMENATAPPQPPPPPPPLQQHSPDDDDEVLDLLLDDLRDGATSQSTTAAAMPGGALRPVIDPARSRSTLEPTGVAAELESLVADALSPSPIATPKPVMAPLSPPASPPHSPAPPPLAPRTISFCHFNDVYEITENAAEPVGGAARFQTAVQRAREQHGDRLITVFSGDGFFPSFFSTILQGRQMVSVLNAIGVDLACVGNHEFDMGLEVVGGLIQQCTFPWLLSNVLDRRTGQPLLGLRGTHILERGGVKIGFLAAVEDWTETLGAIDPEDVAYVDMISTVQRLAAELRAAGVDLVVVLTHNRMPQDYRIAEECDVDLILGGHDHHYETTLRDGTLVVNSGSDFKSLTVVTLTLPPRDSELEDPSARGTAGARPHVEFHRVDVTRDVPRDPSMQAMVEGFGALVGSKMDKVIGHLAVPLEARFAKIRTEETNAGNLLADALRYYARAEIALLNAGSIRADKVLPAGEFTLRDLTSLLPTQDETCVVLLTGAQLVAALENGVSGYPRFDGRFPCVSGVQFAFDPQLPPGSRVAPDSVRVLSGGARAFVGKDERGSDWVPINLQALYKVATKAFVASGRDGYDVFVGCAHAVPPGEGIPLPLAIRNLCMLLDVMNGFKSIKMHESDAEFMARRAAQVWVEKTHCHASREDEERRAAERVKWLGQGIVFRGGQYMLHPTVEGRVVNRSPVVELTL